MSVAYRKPVSVSLPPPLIKEVERVAKRQHQTTSELVRAALRQYLTDVEARRAAWKRARAYGTKKATELGIRTEDDVQRVIDEYRRGDLTPYVASPRRN